MEEQEDRWYKHKSIQARIGYGFIFAIFIVLAWVSRDYGEQLLSKITIWHAQCPDDKCFGVQGVLRISLVLFLFFFGMCLAMIGHKKHDDQYFRTKLQDGFWLIKIVVLIVLIVICYLLPNSVLVWYGYLAMVGAVFFVLVQTVLLVDFAYDWNDSWVAKERYRAVVACSVVILVASFVGVILMYVWFANSTDCGLNIFLVTLSAVLSSIATYLSLRNDIQRGALLTSAVVTGFCTYLVFSALLDKDDCNPFPPSAPTRIWLIVIGVLIAVASLIYNTIMNASQRGFFRMSSTEGEDASLLAHEEGCYNFSYFHLVFASGAMYMAMLFTEWNLHSAVIKDEFNIGPIATWMKIASSWLAVLLYIWSMVGPTLFPNRDWS